MTSLSQYWRRARFYARRCAARAEEVYADRIFGHGERPPFRSLTVEHLIRTWWGFPEGFRNDSLLAVAVLKYALGEEWLERHISPHARDRGVLTIRRGESEDAEIAKMRMVELSESIFNLRRIHGISGCIERMKTAPNPEPFIAEIHIAKMLYANDWPFSFVAPRGREGYDYDFEIDCHGHIVCADAKCKIEETPLSARTITQTLTKARKQIPANALGIFFVKFPQSWTNEPRWQETTTRGAMDFFAQGSGRIVSVVFYVETYRLAGDRLAAQTQLRREVLNPRRRYGMDIDWKLFSRWQPPSNAVDAMPPKWVRLFDFPNRMAGSAGNDRSSISLV